MQRNRFPEVVIGKTITPEMTDNFSNIVAGTLGAVSVGETVVIAAEQAAIRVAVKSATNGGVLEGANFAQRTFGKNFSAAGKFAGQAVDDVAAAIRSGALKVSDVPIDYIVRNGNPLRQESAEMDLQPAGEAEAFSPR